MLEFEILQGLETNAEILEIIKKTMIMQLKMAELSI